MNTNTDPLIELRADGHVATLTFTVSETSKLARKFVAELAALLTAGPKKPLICTTDRSVLAVYKSGLAHVELHNESGMPFRCGKKFADAKGSGTIQFTTDADAIPHGGAWADKRTPESVYRHELPVFNAEAVTRALTDLVESWETSGDLVDPISFEQQRAEYRASLPKLPTEDEQVAAMAQTPIADLDPMNPVRFIPGFLAKVRAYRKAHGLDATQIKDQRVNRARP
ncbi:MAG TPA: hypothetical protein VK700_08745 [Steroidobacteraceae bacterium]|jgi:hypothetical protein|nr:hypothetical protein [Steroidobacteraceae bacterium]